MAGRVTSPTPDLKVWGSRIAHRVVSLDKELYSTLSTQLGVTLQWTSIPSKRGVPILLGVLHAKETAWVKL